jgi:hypothetical protein
MTSKEVSKDQDQVDVVGSEVGPLLSDDDRALIERISAGETVDVDVSALDHAVMVGLHSALKTADDALTDVAGYLGAALELRTWQRIPKADNTPYTSELDFVETQIAAHPAVAAIIRGTSARKAVVAAIDGITDDKGRPVSLRRMGELLGVSKSQVALDKGDAQGASGAAAEGGDRGPQTGGQTVSDKKAVRRHVTGFAAAGTRVRDDAAEMTDDQLLEVIDDARDTLGVALAIAKKRGMELPSWAAAVIKAGGISVTDTPAARLRSGAEGTIATGPVLKGAPVDPAALDAEAASA